MFKEGHSFFIHPFKVIWLESITDSDNPSQLLISVPKRNFKRAVDRNLLKRQIREAFRRNKDEFYAYLSTENREIILAIVFAAKSKVAYSEIDASLIMALKRLVKEVGSEKLKIKSEKPEAGSRE